MQDDNAGLSQWFATRPDARYVFKRNQRRHEMTAITKTQMVNACADYEVDWFFDQTLEEQKEVYRHLQLHGSRGFIDYPDDALFASCVDKGIFLMEE
jgi:alpha-D-ribose 1-methylphosphonate 5-triphosphate synthase subunit PhnH